MILPLEALNIILEKVNTKGEELISVFDSLGRVVSRPVISNKTLPPYDDAAMDGYAVMYEDIKTVPVKLKVKGVIKAGDKVDGLSLASGECYRIMTGAPLPKGADTVVEFEVTKEKDGVVEILKSKKKNANVRFRGEDIKAGDEIDFTGEMITPYRLARLVSTNNVLIPVFVKPTVCIISTGDELVHLGDSRDGIVDSNSFFVKSLLKQIGVEATYLGIARDSVDDFLEKIQQAVKYDIIITSAGISFGDFDVVTNSEKELGINWYFKYVKQKPGKPFAFGKIQNSFIFSFPGNPVSTAFCSFFYLLPAVKKIMGYRSYEHKFVNAVLTKPIKKRNDRVHFNRVRVEFKENRFYATPFETQGSNIIESIANSNGFAMIDSSRIGIIERGEEVRVFLYDYEFLF